MSFHGQKLMNKIKINVTIQVIGEKSKINDKHPYVAETLSIQCVRGFYLHKRSLSE